MPRLPAAESAGALPDGMAPGASVRLAAVAVVYVAYLCAYFVLGPAAFDAGGWYWHDLLVILLTGALLLRAGLHSGPAMRRFLLWNAASLLPLLVSDLSYGRDLAPWREAAGQALQLSDIAYLVFLFAWICAWGLLALTLVQRNRPSGRTITVFLLLMLGVAGLFAGFYAPLYRDSLASLEGRLNVAMAVLELVAVIAGLAVMLLGVSNALVLQLFGVVLLVASDMLYSEASVHAEQFASADPVWMLGLCLLLAGALVLPRQGRQRQAAALDQRSTGGARRSGLSTLLLALSLGAVLVSALVSLSLRGAGRADGADATGAAAGEPFFFVLFVVVLVVVMIWLTDRFDRAVRHAGEHVALVLGQQLQADDWRQGDRRLVWILESTGLGQVLDALHRAAAQLRQDVLFLGPERLNPPPQEVDAGAEPTCFLVMPFGQSDSDTVHRVLREACQQAGLRPLRGDDLFTPTDILDDIWRGITGARYVIADISGRNPNVLYELGIAHTLAKPVLILSRSAEDIPIDLATRRVIVYGSAPGWPEVLAERVQAALRAMRQDYAPAGRTP